MKEICKRFREDSDFERKVLKYSWDACPVLGRHSTFENTFITDSINELTPAEIHDGWVEMFSGNKNYKDYALSVIERFHVDKIKQPLHILTNLGMQEIESISKSGDYDNYYSFTPVGWGSGACLEFKLGEVMFIFKSSLRQVNKDNPPEEEINPDNDYQLQGDVRIKNTVTNHLKEDKMSTLDTVQEKAKNSLALATRIAKGRATLSTIHGLVTKLLPIKWSFMARMTGKDKAITNHPVTQLAEAAAVNALVIQFSKSSSVRTLASAAQDAALLEVAKLIPIEEFVEELTSKLEGKLENTESKS